LFLVGGEISEKFLSLKNHTTQNLSCVILVIN
jgi:hypothetical protein